MAANWERHLQRWTTAGLIDTPTADMIRAYEADREKAQGLRWPILIAIALGGLLFAAGILLFVAAHWDRLSPGTRFCLVLTLVAAAHFAGAIAASRFSILSTTLHAVGTICLGAGIYLTGQIFHLQEHWPGGVMLWAFGAFTAWVLLRHWTQACLAAILIPVWLAGEWSVATHGWAFSDNVLGAGVLLLTTTYLTAVSPEKTSSLRKALSWIGGIALIPATGVVIASGSFGSVHGPSLPLAYHILGWAVAFLLPLAFAWVLRGSHVWPNAIAAIWVAALSAAGFLFEADDNLVHYALCALGSVGLIGWGMKETRKERVNLGIAGFALTVLAFYFSTVMDKLGRSASLIGLGFLFLLGGWLLEKTRRRLLTRIGKGGT